MDVSSLAEGGKGKNNEQNGIKSYTFSRSKFFIRKKLSPPQMLLLSIPIKKRAQRYDTNVK